MALPHLPMPPRCGEHPHEPPQTLLSRDFILLFCMTLFSNSYIAVFYCFEQWLESIAVSPNQRGLLLAALFATVFLFRTPTSILLLRRSKLPALLVSIIVSSCIMLVYPYVRGEHSVIIIGLLRAAQGISLAVFSGCVVTVLVGCIPPGQSARGFALFSLTMLLPYSIIPAVGERILLLVGGEPQLFALTALLGLPSLLMLIPLAPRLRAPDIALTEAGGISINALMRSVTHSGLFFTYLGCICFSVMTILAIFFMKGLSTVTGVEPAWFFSTYTITIILVRIFGSNRLDSMPRYRIILLCAGLLAFCMPGLAFSPLWAFIPLTCLYGLGLGLLYPLMAAVVYDRSTPETRSINSNVMMSTFDLSGMLAPLLGGWVIHAGFGYRGVFAVAGIMVGLCGCCMLMDRWRILRQDSLKIKRARKTAP